MSHGDKTSPTCTMDQTATIETIMTQLRKASDAIVPGFIQNMPAAYYHDMDEDSRLRHIKAIIANQASGLPQQITLRNESGSQYTFINDRSFPGQLSQLVRQLPDTLPLCSARIYTAADNSLVLDVFDLGHPEKFDPEDPEQYANLKRLLDDITSSHTGIDMTDLELHLRGCTTKYLSTIPASVALREYQLVSAARHSGNCQTRKESRTQDKLCQILVAVMDIDPRLLFERISQYLGKQSLNIQRAYLNHFSIDQHEVITLTFLTDPQRENGQPLDWNTLLEDLRHLGYLDSSVIECAEKMKWSLLESEILICLSHLTHQRLVKQDPLLYSRDRIIKTAQRYPQHARAIAGLFLERFSSPSDRTNTLKAELLREQFKAEIDKTDEHLILRMLLDAVIHTLRTNVFAPDRFALSLRIEPSFLTSSVADDLPHGVFFVHGRNFDGFHVRFRDIARGGIRIVRPATREQYVLETERHYDEVYGLAHAQQLKNKDIPEGGSKGVILALPEAQFDHVAKSYADALLDLITSEQPYIRADYLNEDELLYLGPDENISSQLISWIVDRAKLRGHPMPNAFMSSKPTAGINHKVYGVTSEGVTVFLETALIEQGINPRKQPFTVKITGGPDGDVAGNEIRILHREYGENARILGIADGSGCLEDPNGLDHEELLRLVAAEKPVSEYSPAKLSASGRLLTADNPAGIQARNTLHNRLNTDAFIPAGGRPRTINEDNWQNFLSAEGRPSSTLIVEGANLFITPQARELLSAEGVIIIKDSSANKCGVICSSYEIIASMLLDETTFLRIKTVFVQQVLEKLRELASLEAKILFREHRLQPELSFPELSTRLSKAIIRATDAISVASELLWTTQRPLTEALVNRYLPPVLLQEAGSHPFERIPLSYLNQVIASVLASRMVYREGLGWFSHLDNTTITDLAIRYLKEEAEIERLAAVISQSDLPERQRIAQLLLAGGVRAALQQAFY